MRILDESEKEVWDSLNQRDKRVTVVWLIIAVLTLTAILFAGIEGAWTGKSYPRAFCPYCSRYRIFSPGEHIREELAVRGWSARYLAKIIGCKTGVIEQLLNGNLSITTEMARALGEAFGTDGLFWLNLEGQWQDYRKSRISVTGLKA